MAWQSTDNLHLGRIKTDFLIGFAQGCGRRVSILAVLLAARKGDLPRMMFQPCRSLGQDQIARAGTKGDQDRGSRQFAIFRQNDIFVQVKIG